MRGEGEEISFFRLFCYPISIRIDDEREVKGNIHLSSLIDSKAILIDSREERLIDDSDSIQFLYPQNSILVHYLLFYLPPCLMLLSLSLSLSLCLMILSPLFLTRVPTDSIFVYPPFSILYTVGFTFCTPLVYVLVHYVFSFSYTMRFRFHSNENHILCPQIFWGLSTENIP